MFKDYIPNGTIAEIAQRRNKTLASGIYSDARKIGKLSYVPRKRVSVAPLFASVQSRQSRLNVSGRFARAYRAPKTIGYLAAMLDNVTSRQSREVITR